MSFAREKRLLLGWLAALAVLPLPFNDVLEWPFVVIYWLALAGFLYRASQGVEDWLPAWAMNLIGLAYVPVLYIDLTQSWGGQVLRPLLHLATFALVVKLYSLRREGEKWHLLIGIYFLFLAAMGTSVHPSIVLYLIAFLALSMATLLRFASYHFLHRFGQSGSTIEDAPLRRLMAFSLGMTLVVAALLFPLLPRVGTPFIGTGGVGGGQRLQRTGFSEVMTLDSIGRIRANNQVAMRLKYETPPPIGHQLRYKGATYDLFQASQEWRRSPTLQDRMMKDDFGLFKIQDAEPRGWVDVWVEPLGVSSLFIPVEAVAADVNAPSLKVDEGGAILFGRSALGVDYRVAVGESASSMAVEPDEESAALDQGGITPRIAALAQEAMGAGSAAERAERLEQYLVSQYEYTLDVLGRGGDSAIEAFLFQDRRGHCELFASSMVLMLRSQGIPARLVTGFLGGQQNRLEDYFMVRQSNAHAWVEAYLPNLGWTVFEPTPPSGLPGAGSGSFWSSMAQAYDYLIFRWDRYVLTFGAADQATIFGRLRDAWSGLRDLLFRRDQGPEVEAPSTRPDGLGLEERTADESSDTGIWTGWWAILFAVALGAALWSWWKRPRFDAVRAYRLLRRRARRGGLDLPDSIGPLALGDRITRAWPDSADAVEPIVAKYLQESFGGLGLDRQEVSDLRRNLRRAAGSMKKAA